MASLERYVMSDSDRDMCRRLNSMLNEGVFDSSDYAASSFVMSSGCMREIAEAYIMRGEYYDIDYPGGIEQLVRDYRNGKFDE